MPFKYIYGRPYYREAFECPMDIRLGWVAMFSAGPCGGYSSGLGRYIQSWPTRTSGGHSHGLVVYIGQPLDEAQRFRNCGWVVQRLANIDTQPTRTSGGHSSWPAAIIWPALHCRPYKGEGGGLCLKQTDFSHSGFSVFVIFLTFICPRMLLYT